jgi:5-methyltetrahydrofolate--homocysteine methyltransferase
VAEQKENIMILSEFLQKQPIILLDGGMGTQLAKRGLPMGGQNSLLNPEAVLAVHTNYVHAGCQVLITNTLTMNRMYIETHNVGVDVKAVNLAGARLARQAAGTDRYVLGDISSTGRLLEPYGDLKEGDAFESFKEQAAYLLEAGVDGLIIETMIDLNETLCALRACKAVTALPVIASLSFATTKRGGRTTMGNSAADCAKTLTDAGADVIGTNCGDLTPLEMAEVIATLRNATTVPLIAQPNAGKPRLENDQTIFDMGPAEFAQGVLACINAGARLVGGCCGTSPDHIRAVAELVS